MDTLHAVRRLRLPHYATLVIALNLALVVSYVGLWFASLNQNLFWRADFTAFYTGWMMVRDGVRENLYDFELQRTYQQQLLAEYTTQGGLLPYINPPHFALMLAPLAFFTLPHAFYLWTVAQLGLIVLLVRQLVVLTTDWSQRDRVVLVTTVLAFPPLLFTLLRGTLSLLILVVLLGLYRALISGQAHKAGFWLMVGAVKPQLIVMPALALLANRRWTILLSAGVLTTVLVLISALFLSPASWLGFLGTVQAIDQSYGSLGVVPTTMYNLKGTLTLWFGGEQLALIGLVSNVGFGLALLITFWLGQHAYPPDSLEFGLRLALVILLSLFFNPHLNSHDGLLMVLPIVMLARSIRERQQRWGWVALLPLVPIITLVSEFSIEGDFGLRFPTAFMLVLIFWLGRELHRLAQQG